jgi:signal transduction histidine kinase
MINRLGKYIAQGEQRLTLAQQFAIAGSVVLFAGMVAIGLWVTRQIQDGVIGNIAATTALYVDSVISPLAQELTQRDTLSPEARADLDALVKKSNFGKRIVSLKIWKPGGLIAYASHPEMIGKVFPTTPNLVRGWKGELSAEFGKLLDEADALERAAGLPLVEIYSPLRESGTGRVIAVAEFYETVTTLKQIQFRATLSSWAVVATVTISMLTLLFVIVLRGSMTIQNQRQALVQRIQELSRLLTQIEELRNRVQQASRRTTEINESYLRRISADLHDGPAQLLALAALHLDKLKPPVTNISQAASDQKTYLEIVRESLTSALTELRDICTGLTLPELDELAPADVLRNATHAHERRTDTTVELAVHSVPDELARSMKICVYRFIQEALNNAFSHAGGRGQAVDCRYQGGMLEVTVTDTGPGFDPSQKTETEYGLGLPGLRERIESLGGTLNIFSAPGQGTRLTMYCRLHDEEWEYVG